MYRVYVLNILPWEWNERWIEIDIMDAGKCRVFPSYDKAGNY